MSIPAGTADGGPPSASQVATPAPRQEAGARARALAALVPWLDRNTGHVQVVLWPGGTLPESLADVAALHGLGVPVVVVPDLSGSEADIRLCAAAMVAGINGARGRFAVGLSGEDGRQLTACPARCRRPPPHGTGGIHDTDPRLARLLLDARLVPVVAPVAPAPDGRPRVVRPEAVTAALARALAPAREVRVDGSDPHPLLRQVFREQDDAADRGTAGGVPSARR